MINRTGRGSITLFTSVSKGPTSKTKTCNSNFGWKGRSNSKTWKSENFSDLVTFSNIRHTNVYDIKKNQEKIEGTAKDLGKKPSIGIF